MAPIPITVSFPDDVAGYIFSFLDVPTLGRFDFV